jgi:hypothetical protein
MEFRVLTGESLIRSNALFLCRHWFHIFTYQKTKLIDSKWMRIIAVKSVHNNTSGINQNCLKEGYSDSKERQSCSLQ